MHQSTEWEAIPTKYRRSNQQIIWKGDYIESYFSLKLVGDCTVFPFNAISKLLEDSYVYQGLWIHRVNQKLIPDKLRLSASASSTASRYLRAILSISKSFTASSS